MKNNFIKYSQTVTIAFDKDHQLQAYKKAEKMKDKEGFKMVVNFDGEFGYIELTKHYETEIN